MRMVTSANCARKILIFAQSRKARHDACSEIRPVIKARTEGDFRVRAGAM
jgi:hypothetical protein